VDHFGSGAGAGVAVDAEQLHAQLRQRGLVVLAVAPVPLVPEVLVVYLHANAGQWVAGMAQRAILRVPGVMGVTESRHTPCILLVRLNSVGAP
jgi:hypothetical protein